MSLTEQQKIGSFIAQLREQQGMTQAEFAKALKTSQPAVARMEKGDQNFSTETLSRVGAVLGREVVTLASPSVNFRVEGGHKLSGSIKTNSSKNAAMSLLCASLLNRGRTVLHGMPKIEEVFRILEVLTSIGVTVNWNGQSLELHRPATLNLKKLDRTAATRTRSVLMMIGALAPQLPYFEVPLSGGCTLGERTVRPHLFALENLGVRINTISDRYEVTTKKTKPATVVLYEMGDTVTENILLAAALTPGETTIKLASSNYMVQDLCFFLEELGVQIEGVGTRTLVVHGQEKINRDVEYYISEDPIESMMFLSLAATTGSHITIERCPIDFLELELLKLEKMGFKFKRSKPYLSKNGKTNLVDLETLGGKLTALEEKIHPLPSGFGINIDNLPFFVPVAAVATGKTLIHDWVYENRAIYFLELQKLRANITLVDPHRVYVEGPVELRGAEVICPPALRPAVIILIAMLAAKGTSVLRNVYSISRGYEDLAERLRTLGAKIEVIRGM